MSKSVSKPELLVFSNLQNLDLIIKSTTFLNSLQWTSFLNFCCIFQIMNLHVFKGGTVWRQEMKSTPFKYIFLSPLCVFIWVHTHTKQQQQHQSTNSELCPYSEKKWLVLTHAIEPVWVSSGSSQIIANMCWVKTSLVGSKGLFFKHNSWIVASSKGCPQWKTDFYF